MALVNFIFVSFLLFHILQGLFFFPFTLCSFSYLSFFPKAFEPQADLPALLQFDNGSPVITPSGIALFFLSFPLLPLIPPLSPVSPGLLSCHVNRASKIGQEGGKKSRSWSYSILLVPFLPQFQP
jgi:hypothetical protein